MEKPFSAASERNQGPILEVMKTIVTSEDRRLLEIGSGTGQHAVYFAPHFPRLRWYPTDRASEMAGMKLWLQEAQLHNVENPTRLEIGRDEFPKLKFDIVFTANTFHIMHWKECKTLMKMLGNRLREGARVLIYGPFNYNGQFTSEGNEALNLSLKQEDSGRGIRSFEDVSRAMLKHGFSLIRDFEMPANNRLLVFQRLPFESRG